MSKRMKKTNNIISWSIKVEYEDKTTKEIADVPNFVSDAVDEWLKEMEVSNDKTKYRESKLSKREFYFYF